MLKEKKNTQIVRRQGWQQIIEVEPWDVGKEQKCTAIINHVILG